MEDKAISEKLRIDDSFRFSCGRELGCYNLCCRDINLFLTPYDILRIKRRLAIPSYEFLKTYTLPLFPEEIGHPVILLRMVPDETRNCPFVSNDGCTIYDDRPWSCRSFPLEPGAGSDPQEFEIVKRDFCMGFDKGKNHSIQKWRTSQNVGLYEEVNEEWKKVTHHENFSSQNLLEGRARDIFFLGSYNIDEFRNVVFKGDFLKYFDIDKKVLKNIKSSDTELLKFSFRWLRHVLFGEDTLRQKLPANFRAMGRADLL
jgi:Fe-S-cluster containining protein